MKRAFATDEAATLALGAGLGIALAAVCQGCPQPFVIFLQGDLGAGKTTLARAVLRSLGVEGVVRSPTYTLMERYPWPGGAALHLDLYRLADPEELEFLGLRDAPGTGEIMLVEWPQRGERHLPQPDLCIDLMPADQVSTATPGEARWLTIDATTEPGERVISEWGL